ncbi:hypothetical protein DQM68_12235 [Leptospira mayottensis]|uniref:Uncharacterized protein n=1 Tax=Leptospira mayottensis TaxID=1137606 RepID=A0ABM6YBH3_9LEPT|nr:hypothetical protein DQM68_12235 [Leptospira mayottensis]AXR65417.1 hypothetical protein DQM28_15515 [Leptospira mayottensis]AZQ02236.1 hypothetical protein LEP1GSC190_09480 [Leptospira mayottensis 200901116]
MEKQRLSFPTANLEIRGRVANDKFRLFFHSFLKFSFFLNLKIPVGNNSKGIKKSKKKLK